MGASVDLAMVVNNVPQYQLRVFVDREKQSINCGKGLALDELEYLAGIINDHIAKLKKSSP